MSDVAAGIARYLKEQGFERVYCDFLPDAPDDAIAVYEYQETAPYCGMGHSEGAARRDIRIRVRRASRAAAFAAAHEAYASLDSGADERTILLDGVEAVIRPKRLPALLERDARNRVLFAWNLSVV